MILIVSEVTAVCLKVVVLGIIDPYVMRCIQQVEVYVSF